MCSAKTQLNKFIVPLVTLVVIAISSQLNAQVFFNGAGGDNEEAMKKQFVESLKKKKAAAENRIQSRIADMDRACDLSESQQKKLSIASKGAVNAAMEKAKKSMEQQAKSMGFDIDFDELESEDEEEAEEEEDGNPNAAGAAFAIQAVMVDSFNGGGNTNVEDHKIWKSAIKKVLDEEQTKKWDEWLEQRNAYQRRVAVENFVAKVDRKLLLSPEQREELAKYVDEKHGKKLLKKATSNDGNNLGMNIIVNGMMGGVNQADPEEADEQLKSILTESQLEEWQQSIQGQLSGGGGFGGGINVIGNALNGINIVEEFEMEEMDEEDDDN